MDWMIYLCRWDSSLGLNQGFKQIALQQFASELGVVVAEERTEQPHDHLGRDDG
jgi:TorA maturation chaperone TorD